MVRNAQNEEQKPGCSEGMKPTLGECLGSSHGANLPVDMSERGNGSCHSVPPSKELNEQKPSLLQLGAGHRQTTTPGVVQTGRQILGVATY